MNRRSFLGMAATTGAAMLAPRWLFAQAQDPISQARAAAATAKLTTTRLYDDLHLIQGAGGNMVVQTGAQGKLLIDSSFSSVTTQLRAILDSLSSDPAHLLINTHWHFDHTDGNEGMHNAGFHILAHEKTLDHLSHTVEIRFLHATVQPAPRSALPETTFDGIYETQHSGDTLTLASYDPAHTDSDISIHFHKADVLDVADTWFNGFYPFIDESTGGNINGMIAATQKSLSIASAQTKIVPGHGPLGTKVQLRRFHDMLVEVRDKVAALKHSGASEQEAIAEKPTSNLDAIWGNGIVPPDPFVGIVYRTI